MISLNALCWGQSGFGQCPVFDRCWFQFAQTHKVSLSLSRTGVSQFKFRWDKAIALSHPFFWIIFSSWVDRVLVTCHWLDIIQKDLHLFTYLLSASQLRPHTALIENFADFTRGMKDWEAEARVIPAWATHAGVLSAMLLLLLAAFQPGEQPRPHHKHTNKLAGQIWKELSLNKIYFQYSSQASCSGRITITYKIENVKCAKCWADFRPSTTWTKVKLK